MWIEFIVGDCPSKVYLLKGAAICLHCLYIRKEKRKGGREGKGRERASELIQVDDRKLRFSLYNTFTIVMK